MSQTLPPYLKAEINRLEAKIKLAKTSLLDPQLKELAEQEIKSLQKQKQILLNSQPSQSPKAKHRPPPRLGNAIIEVRAAAGGQEAKLWANDLLEMYVNFALTQKLTVIPLGHQTIKVKGKSAYPLFCHEAGVHRVQRVPQTESQGRVHTSTATVAVLPEITAAEINIKPQDISVNFFRSSGSGGQNVNKVSTAVRLKHLPTGIIIESQTQRTQEQNRKIALDLLRSQLYQIEKAKKQAQITQARQAVGRGMRSEKIRTYNFPQNRLTDHRLKKSWKNLDRVLAGDLLPIISAFAQS